MATTQARQAAVLFANVTDAAALRESRGREAALEAVERCVGKLRESVESSHGRVVKVLGDHVMAVFATPDAAAFAASSMQYAVDGLAPPGGPRLGVGVGFHYGELIQSGDDFFGGTVNLAARLAEKAATGDIITSQETSRQLGAMFRPFIRPPYALHVKGKTEEVQVCELIWRQAGEQTLSFANRTPVKEDPRVLRLKYRDREILCRRHNDLIVLGREVGCDLVIADKMASRHHCTIERRQDKFVLADQSANGTYVTPGKEAAEILLRREEITLVKHGWIAFGQPRSEAEAVAEYFCE